MCSASWDLRRMRLGRTPRFPRQKAHSLHICIPRSLSGTELIPAMGVPTLGKSWGPQEQVRVACSLPICLLCHANAELVFPFEVSLLQP